MDVEKALSRSQLVKRLASLCRGVDLKPGKEKTVADPQGRLTVRLKLDPSGHRLEGQITPPLAQLEGILCNFHDSRRGCTLKGRVQGDGRFELQLPHSAPADDPTPWTVSYCEQPLVHPSLEQQAQYRRLCQADQSLHAAPVPTRRAEEPAGSITLEGPLAVVRLPDDRVPFRVAQLIAEKRPAAIVRALLLEQRLSDGDLVCCRTQIAASELIGDWSPEEVSWYVQPANDQTLAWFRREEIARLRGSAAVQKDADLKMKITQLLENLETTNA